MRIVKSNNTIAIGRMERQRLADAVWPLRRRRRFEANELHPMAARGIDHKNLAIQAKKIVEAGIAGWFQHCMNVITG